MGRAEMILKQAVVERRGSAATPAHEKSTEE
jgi:hypothetical protein